MSGTRLSFQESLTAPGGFAVTWELVPGRGAFEDSQETVLRLAEQASKDPRVNGITITDNPGGKTAISAFSLALEIKRLGIDPIVHFTCKDKNRNATQSELYALERSGVGNLIVMSGDYPMEGYTGRPKPVFDVDPVQMLRLIGEMNAGESIATPKGSAVIGGAHFFAGAVVSPFKLTEAEQMTQYYKLHKKIAAGARFIVSQVGYDPAKFEELKMYMAMNSLNVTLVGNIYVLTAAAARMMNENMVPGCIVTDKLLKTIQEEKSRFSSAKEGQLLRAAKLYGIFRGLGYNGVHIGGHGLKYQDLQYIMEKGEELAPNWQEAAQELNACHNEGFYYFKRDEKTGMNLPEVSNSGKKGLGLQLSYKIFDFADYLFFDPKGLFFKGAQRLLLAIDRSFLKKPFTHMEHVIKYLSNECRFCGDCAMLNRAYICPMGKCAKQQRNGPCGGSYNGWCEVYPGERKCIYALAYNRLKTEGKQLKLRDDYIPPCNWELYNTASWLNYMAGRDFSRIEQPKPRKKPAEGAAEAVESGGVV